MVEMIDRIGKLERARCRHWVEEHFSVQRMVEGYERLYKIAAYGHWSAA
jgi:hypothetical protein